MTLVELHGHVIGYAIVGSWATISGWALGLRLTRHRDTPTFWRAVSVAQILLLGQFVVGVVLLLLGGRPGPPGAGAFDLVFHLLYGAGFPLLVLVVAHKWARDGRYNPHSVFALAALVIFGLTARGWQTGIVGA